MKLNGSVCLPISKSESNRVLMIAAYGGFSLETENGELSEAHDTVLLKALLKQTSLRTTPNVSGHSAEEIVVDCEDAGTASRFLMTYLACLPGTWVLKGTSRMQQRPMAPLIETLRQLGADIKCLDAEGKLPVKIKGTRILGGRVEIDASKSSQFVSSLLLAAPTWEKGLRLRLKEGAVSLPYVDMTVSTMRHFGAVVERHDSEIVVLPGAYQSKKYMVSADWSAASYWYEMAALSEDCDLMLEGLKLDPLQGDSEVVELYQSFGVQTSCEPRGVHLTKTTVPLPEKPLELDFSMKPDLFPAVFVTCVALHCPAVFRGIQNLALKESDRASVLITELSKIYSFKYTINHNEIIIDSSILVNQNNFHNRIVFRTFDDHRVAMALSGLSLVLGSVIIDRPEVVSKSYPTFWDEMSNIL
ncbi:MAG: 3-phosphoshikimate 1-carboxyvinyltransferase [Bacteroidales bacterium]|nr:3-phosphoshikimate 1-carboxyvinyltransferase [Bacteroidales bacterium]